MFCAVPLYRGSKDLRSEKRYLTLSLASLAASVTATSIRFQRWTRPAILTLSMTMALLPGSVLVDDAAAGDEEEEEEEEEAFPFPFPLTAAAAAAAVAAATTLPRERAAMKSTMRLH